jgi:hypothetical protein
MASQIGAVGERIVVAPKADNARGRDKAHARDAAEIGVKVLALERLPRPQPGLNARTDRPSGLGL